MIPLICLGVSLLALIIALGEIEHQRDKRAREMEQWRARGAVVAGLQFSRRQAG
jgi:hypothetical protein